MKKNLRDPKKVQLTSGLSFVRWIILIFRFLFNLKKIKTGKYCSLRVFHTAYQLYKKFSKHNLVLLYDLNSYIHRLYAHFEVKFFLRYQKKTKNTPGIGLEVCSVCTEPLIRYIHSKKILNLFKILLYTLNCSIYLLYALISK